jgi:sporulation protein YhbH
MTEKRDRPGIGFSQMTRWYDLFSRGARDWLRHNEKVKDAVRASLPDLLANADVMTGDAQRKLQVPVRFLEHFRFRLSDAGQSSGVGQGDAKPGDVLSSGRPRQKGKGGSGAGEGEGGVEFILELELNDIVDVLWEELELPNLQPRANTVEEDDYTRSGWDKRGARARLDRRRTLREAVKRRAVQEGGPPFINDDLRYRQLVRRPRPSTQAAVIFGLDASSSMSERDRKLAKSFFFWALQGLRRQYRRIDTAFVAHTIDAWEFSEEDFFQVTGQGGTIASTAFNRVLQIIEQRFPPSNFNLYFFYASDGENFAEDQLRALDSLRKLGAISNFLGYVETAPETHRLDESETARLYSRLPAGVSHDTYRLTSEASVWEAIRRFFRRQVEEAA